MGNRYITYSISFELSNMQKIHFLFLFLLISVSAFSQNLTLSPYSRYGIGDVFSYSNVRSAGMGSVGIATSTVFSPNRYNPASYSDYYLTTNRTKNTLRRTTLDVSGFANVNFLSTEKGKGTQSTAGFRDLTFVFPSNKKLAIAFGFAPYSAVGYTVRDTFRTQIDTNKILSVIDYAGRGGLNQAFVGGATSFWGNRIRAGANLYYAFGNVQNEWSSYLFYGGAVQTITTRNSHLSGIGALVGVQYQDTLKKDSTNGSILLRLGLVTDYNVSMNASRTTIYGGNVTDTLGNEIKSSINVPTKYGIGFELSKPLKWYVAGDILYQNWKNFQYFNDKIVYGSDLQAGLGGEFTPNMLGDKYLQRISYRGGGYFHKTYLDNFGGKSVTDQGVSLGVGIPMSRSKQAYSEYLGRFNLSVELGQRGSLGSQPLSELYSRVRFGITISERWFVRRVVD